MRRVELHCHTEYSFDGLISIESLFRTAKLCGLNAVAVTDHDTVEGAIEARKWSSRRNNHDIEIILGEERTLADGSHLIGLFLQEPISSVTFEAAVAEIEQQGGLCVVPHPFRRKDGLLRERDGSFLKAAGFRGAVEVFNAKVGGDANARANLELSGFPCVVGSDAHYECDLGEAINVISGNGSLREAVDGVISGRDRGRLMVKRQLFAGGERKYAAAYYKIRPILKVPRVLLPLAKEVYRRYRNSRCGVGPKALVELGES